MSEIKNRLEKVVSQTSVCDQWQQDMKELNATVERLENDTCALRSRLDDAEDRSRRNNLIFYGISDAADETSSDSETKILDLLNNTLKVNINSSDICRAHRIGRFATGKNRPLITRFETYKTRELVSSKRGLLKDTDTAMSEDFCQATRNIRKKLIEYGKSKTTSFKLSYKRLTFNGKTYGYDETKQTIYEMRSYDKKDDNNGRVLRSGRVVTASS